MRLFIISRRRAAERRRSLRAALAGSDVEWSFFEAIDIRRDRSRFFHHCDEKRFLLHTGRTPSSAELGRFASHLMLWRSCRLLHEPLLILEDDLQPGADFDAALSFVRRHIERLGFLRLLAGSTPLRRPVAADGRWRIDRAEACPSGALAYAVSPRAADALIRHSEVFHAPVDLYIGRYWVHGQSLFALSPPAVSDALETRRAAGRAQPRQAPHAGIAWQRRLHRLRDRLRRALYDLRRLRRPAGQPPDNAVRGVAAATFRSDS